MPYLTVVDLIKASWLRLNYWCKTKQNILGHVHMPALAGILMHVCIADICTSYVCTLSPLADTQGEIQGKRWQLLNQREKKGWAKAKDNEEKRREIQIPNKGRK